MKELRIDAVERIDDFRRCLAIQKETWRFDDIDVVPLHVLITAAHTGGLVLGAWVQDEMVGFVFGFAGLDSAGTPYHHSHMAAVLPDYRGLGIGYALKREQAQRLAQQGTQLIVWTYDPLEARNAHFNLNRLGAIARTYLVNHYGILGGGLNAGLESDRFRVEQWLNSNRVNARLNGALTRSAPALFRATTWPADWCEASPRPPDVVPTVSLPETLIEIPADFQQIKQEDMGLARAWRAYFRQICMDAFSRGFAVVSLWRRPASAGSAQPIQTYYHFRPLPSGPLP
ncbi:MAG TPA: GNAT family N-acetyltransferase [Caldilineae bacterium]|nr:GNAT family N-acetyltransferase [Caldilineae bacterium]